MTNSKLEAFIEKNQWLEAIWILAKQDFPYLCDDWKRILSDWVELSHRAWKSEFRIMRRIDRLNYLFFSEVALKSTSAWKEPSSIYIHTVLNRKFGNCLGLSALYLAVADSLEIPFVPMLVNEHVFIRYDDGKLQRNIETTKNGANWIDCLYAPASSSSKKNKRFRVLSHREFLALVIVAHCAYIYAPQERWEEASYDLELSIKLFPDCVHAYINRAIAQKNLGNEASAVQDIETALKIGQETDYCGLTTDFFLKRFGKIDISRLIRPDAHNGREESELEN